MTEVWAQIDARHGGAVDTTTIVGGLPLVSRLVRQLARLGFAGAQVVCDHAEARTRVRRALDRCPGPGSFPVEVVIGHAPRTPRVALDGRALYDNAALARARDAGGAPATLFVVASLADRAEAVRRLFRALGKNLERDGWFSYHVTRPIARRLSRWLLPTAITPNQVTVAAVVCGVVAAVLVGRGAGPGTPIAGALLLAGMLLDNVDGDLARVRLQFSRLGEWLDAMGDEVVTLGVTVALGVGLARDGEDPAWRWAAAITAGVGALVLSRLYVELARARGPIDTAAYPWFFRRRPAGGIAAQWYRRAVTVALELVMRRDVYISAIAAMIMLDRKKAALVALITGLGGLAVTYGVHVIVTAVRRRRGSPRATCQGDDAG